MNKKAVLKHLKQLFFELVGSAFAAMGIYNFAINANFPICGFSGIALIIYRLFDLPIGLTIIVMNIPVAILCYKLIGKKFFFSSVRCMIISSLMIDYLAPLFPAYSGNRLLAAICTGVFTGLGYAIIFMQNSSTGGMDFIIMAIKSKKPHIAIGKISFFLDAMVILIGGLLFSDMDGIIYGMIESYLLAKVMDKLIYGINAGKMTLIVTDHGKSICDVIDSTCDRGSTIIPAIGGYKEDPREVVMCACNDKEMYLVQRAVKEADPKAFMIVLESNEVHGEGFHTVQLGEKES